MDPKRIYAHEKHVIYSWGRGKVPVTERDGGIIPSMKSIRRAHFDAVCLQSR